MYGALGLGARAPHIVLYKGLGALIQGGCVLYKGRGPLYKGWGLVLPAFGAVFLAFGLYLAYFCTILAYFLPFGGKNKLKQARILQILLSFSKVL